MPHDECTAGCSSPAVIEPVTGRATEVCEWRVATASPESIKQSCIFTVVQIIKSLQDPLEMGNNLPGSTIMSGNEAWNRNDIKRWRMVDRDGADITLSGRLFQLVGPATGKARPPTVDSFTDGISRRLVRAERRERRPGRSATRTSWLRHDGAVPAVIFPYSSAASTFFDRYQTIYCWRQRHARVCEQLARGCHLKAERPGLEPAIFWVACSARRPLHNPRHWN